MSSENEIFCQRLKRALAKTVTSLSGLAVPLSTISLDAPDRSDFGQLTTNMAMQTFARLDAETKRTYRSPQAWAQALVETFMAGGRWSEQLARVEAVGPGFINFYYSKQQKILVLKEFLTSSNKLNDCPQGQVIIDYSSPNIAKPFTVGHLRSTIIGDAVANLLEATGWTVYRDNHLGDWGTQFGKQVVAIEKWGDWNRISRSLTPIKDLVDLYVKFHQEADQDPTLEDEARRVFALMEQGDEHYLSLWQKIVDLSMKEFEDTYRRLGVEFTENGGRGYGESFVRDQTEAVVDELRDKGLLTESQGAQVVVFPPGDHLPPLLILKNDGSTLYQTRELAMDKWRLKNYGESIKIINEIGREQSLYCQQMYRLEELLGWFKPEQRVHVGHGLYRFADRKMSTRKGDVIWLQDILTAAEAKVRELSEKTLSEADVAKIAVGAIKWNDLSREALSDIDFDLQTMISLKGNSGPYMQYTVCRINSIMEKANLPRLNQNKDKMLMYKQKLAAKLSLMTESAWGEAEWAVVDELNNYLRRLQLAADKLAPHLLAGYLYAVAQKFNNYYSKNQILSDESRLFVTQVTGVVLSEGLGILGIALPDKM